LATRTSTVASGGGGSGALGASGVRLPLASMAATAPAARAITNTMMRERFIPLQLPKNFRLPKSFNDSSIARRPEGPPCRNFIS
jgi:hypothetical protein